MTTMPKTDAPRVKAPVQDRCRVLFADQLNLARGKYVPMSDAARGHTRMCVGTFAVTYDKTLVAAPGGGMLDGLPDMEVSFDPQAMRPSWDAGTQIALGALRFKGEPFVLCGRSALQRAINAWPMMAVGDMEAAMLRLHTKPDSAQAKKQPKKTELKDTP